jgi:hypothetical protein
MARSHLRLSLVAVTAAALVGVALGLLGWRSHRLADEHALRAQKALDELGRHVMNINLCLDSLKTARLTSAKTRIRAIMKSSERMVTKLEEVAVRHERLARYYGHRSPLKRTDTDSTKYPPKRPQGNGG